MLLGCVKYHPLRNHWIAMAKCLLPIGLLGHIYDGFQLCFTYCSCFSRFTLFKGLSDAENNLEACVERGACFSSYDFWGFVEKSTTFGVTWSRRKMSRIIRCPGWKGYRITKDNVWDSLANELFWAVKYIEYSLMSINKLRYLISPVNAPDSLW